MANIDFSAAPDYAPSRKQRAQQVYQFDDGQALAVSPPPLAGVSECEGAVTRCVATLASFIKQRQAITGDATLSPMGKQNKLAPLANAAIKTLYGQYDALMAFGGAVMTRQAALFGVPPIPQGNAVQALLDRECREWWRALPDRSAMMPKLTSGQLPALALALMRSPVPLDADAELVANAWRASVG